MPAPAWAPARCVTGLLRRCRGRCEAEADDVASEGIQGSMSPPSLWQLEANRTYAPSGDTLGSVSSYGVLVIASGDDATVAPAVARLGARASVPLIGGAVREDQAAVWCPRGPALVARQECEALGRAAGAATRKMSKPSPRSAANAMRRPSGDHAGSRSMTGAPGSGNRAPSRKDGAVRDRRASHTAS